MKYFIDTEFHEHFCRGWFRRPTPTIDLISIGIVDEDGRSFYAISKEFDVKAAWEDKWLRENVLKPIYCDLRANISSYEKTHHWCPDFIFEDVRDLVKRFGSTRLEIATGIVSFINPHVNFEKGNYYDVLLNDPEYRAKHNTHSFPPDSNGPLYMWRNRPEFYAYYASYDWVVFCWLFGRMVLLPKGFPMYCRDLKQMLDDWVTGLDDDWVGGAGHLTFDAKLEAVKELSDWPTQENEHNALDDARWNKALCEFLAVRKD